MVHGSVLEKKVKIFEPKLGFEIVALIQPFKVLQTPKVSKLSISAFGFLCAAISSSYSCWKGWKRHFFIMSKYLIVYNSFKMCCTETRRQKVVSTCCKESIEPKKTGLRQHLQIRVFTFVCEKSRSTDGCCSRLTISFLSSLHVVPGKIDLFYSLQVVGEMW